MSAYAPFFAQIACSVANGGENLYALDRDGHVWFYRFDENRWARLKTQWNEELEDPK